MQKSKDTKIIKKPGSHSSKVSLNNLKKRANSTATHTPNKKTPKHATKHVRSSKVTEIPAIDVEQVLINRISRNESERKVPRKALFIPEIMYASSTNLRELAFSNGISAGRMMHESSDKTMNALLTILEQAGLGQVLYHLFENTGVITAKPSIVEPNIKARVHTYEAGIIAGFLGAFAHHGMNVSETHCIYDGNEMCQFKISELPDSMPINRNIDSRELLDSVIRGIRNRNHNGYVSEEYFLLYSFPLTMPPISEGMSKLMYLAAKSMSADLAWFSEDNLKLIKESFGLRSVKLLHRQKGNAPNSIVVEYEHLGSNSQFLSISQSFLHGLVDGMKNASATSHIELGSKNNYILYIQLNPVK